MEKMIRLEFTESEFNMIVGKLNWMGCVVKDGNLDYKKYCNGDCHDCDDYENAYEFKNWIKSKIVTN